MLSVSELAAVHRHACLYNGKVSAVGGNSATGRKEGMAELTDNVASRPTRTMSARSWVRQGLLFIFCMQSTVRSLGSTCQFTDNYKVKVLAIIKYTF